MKLPNHHLLFVLLKVSLMHIIHNRYIHWMLLYTLSSCHALLLLINWTISMLRTFVMCFRVMINMKVNRNISSFGLYWKQFKPIKIRRMLQKYCKQSGLCSAYREICFRHRSLLLSRLCYVFTCVLLQSQSRHNEPDKVYIYAMCSSSICFLLVKYLTIWWFLSKTCLLLLMHITVMNPVRCAWFQGILH